jgi:hypothetical protein
MKRGSSRRSNRNPRAFAANKFHTTARALEFVEQLYAAGATEVLVDNILDDQLRAAEPGPYADTLIIRCRTNRARAALLGMCEDAIAGEAEGRVNEAGGAIEVWWD